MISSFFGKTKPINYIVLSVFLFLFYGVFLFLFLKDNGGAISIPLEVLTLGILLLTIFVINQIIKTEKVTDFSSYAMLFFVLLIVTFADILLDKNAIFAAFFLLLAVWRLLSVKTIRNVKHKVFDASFLICVASLFQSQPQFLLQQLCFQLWRLPVALVYLPAIQQDDPLDAQ